MADVRAYLFDTDETGENRELWSERLADEQATLDVMRGQVELNAMKAGQEKPESRMLEALGLEISLVEEEKVLRMIQKKMGPEAHHFVRAFEVKHQATHASFDGYVSGCKSRKKRVALAWEPQ